MICLAVPSIMLHNLSLSAILYDAVLHLGNKFDLIWYSGTPPHQSPLLAAPRHSRLGRSSISMPNFKDAPSYTKYSCNTFRYTIRLRWCQFDRLSVFLKYIYSTLFVINDSSSKAIQHIPIYRYTHTSTQAHKHTRNAHNYIYKKSKY